MRSAARAFARPIGVIVDIVFALSVIILIGSVIAGTERFGGFVVTALALDHWYPPVMSATPDQISLAAQVALSASLVVFTFRALTWLALVFARRPSTAASGISDQIVDLISDILHVVFHRQFINRAKKKALQRVSDLYDDQGRFGAQRSPDPAIGVDDLPALLQSIADTEMKISPLDGDFDYTERFTREAVVDIAKDTDHPALAIPHIHARQTKAAIRWLSDMDIYIDLKLGLTFIRRGSIDPALLPHALATLNAAQDSVLAVPTGTAEWVLRQRQNLEAQADALSVARGYYHDDEIPETKDEIVRWALAVVEEGADQ